MGAQQKCPACSAKGGFDVWGKPQSPGHMHFKVACRLCVGSGSVTGQWTRCAQCQGKGGFDAWNKPKRHPATCWKRHCDTCEGKGYVGHSAQSHAVAQTQVRAATNTTGGSGSPGNHWCPSPPSLLSSPVPHLRSTRI
jgi:DnaJ-class molecular chaperone|eukprot:COSAG01_NODE_6770_length_3506_cov_51.170825_4_plen_138_part_00